MKSVFPGKEWEWAGVEESGFDPEKLEAARMWLVRKAGEAPYRVVVVRGGRMVAEWEMGVDTDTRFGMASATKSLFGSMLGIAIADGKIDSATDPVGKYFPEYMNVPEGKGPKPGRFAKPEDRDITLRQLISNTSGYMKPGELPGKQYHYQTFGMNILCHAISCAYGMYDSSDPDRLPGLGKLIEDKIRNPIGGSWDYRYTDFEHPPGALTNIFGRYSLCVASARDMARMGLLWLHFGRWEDRQVIPEHWMREASGTAPDILENCPEKEWCYGYGFWTNDHKQLWPSLPEDSFAASGAGKKHVWVCPSLDLVVAQSSGIYEDQSDCDRGLLGHVVAACSAETRQA